MTFLLVASSGVIPLGLLYWLLVILWLIFGLYTGWPRVAPDNTPRWSPLGGSLLLWVLFVLIGLALFGWPIGGR